MRKKSIMSDNLRNKIAEELGVQSTVANQGWRAVSSRDCGNLVKKAIEIANRNYQWPW